MIQLHNVTFVYESATQPAVNSVNLEIPSGTVIAIVGPNGSGKSTLARLLNGLLLPSAGSVVVDTLDTRTASPLALRQLVGLVWQNPDNQLVAGVVEDDVAFGPENLGLSPHDIERRVDEALDLVGLQSLRMAATARLSAGQKQLVAIAGIVALEPRYLVLDEATARLDPDTAQDLLDALLAWARARETSIILITHQLWEVLRADWLYRMADGRVVAYGRPEVLLREAKFAGDELLQTSLYDIVFHLEQLGVKLSAMPGSVKELVGFLCR